MNIIDSPLFSIIVPCYNSTEYIESCFTGLRKQTIDPNFFEILFIDDCSSDDTVQKLNKFKESADFNVIVLQNANNLGPSLSRRKGAEVASGEFLCFCDSDDWYSANCLDELREEIDKSAADLVIFDMSYILRGKTIVKRVTSKFVYGDKSSYLAYCGESLCNMVVRKTIFLSVQPIDIRHGEDLALVPSIIMKSNIITHLDKPMYNYIMRGSSVSMGKVNRDAYINMLKAYAYIRNGVSNDDESLDKCIEFLGIKIILYDSTLMAVKGNNENSVLCGLVSDFEKQYAYWCHNSHQHALSISKRIYLWAVRERLWFLIRLYAKLHSLVLL